MSSLHQAVDTFASELQSSANTNQVRERRREWIAWVRQQFQGLIPFPFQAGKSCSLLDMSGQVVGYVGEIIHQDYNLKPVRKSFAVEIYLPALSLSQAQQVSAPRREVDSFDISVLVDENTRISTIQELIGETLGQDLVTMLLIDIYTGKQIGAGLRSFTFRIVYARSRGEPGMIWTEIASIITQKLHAEVRGAN